MKKISNIQKIELSEIHTSHFNPRKRFPEKELNELADSIKKNGVLQPILLRPANVGYEIVFGERRYRASIIAGHAIIPAEVQEISDQEAFGIALAENINREDLTTMEEADFYRELCTTAKYDITTLCTTLGKSESYIRIRLKLNNLISDFRELLDENVINVSIAFELAKYTHAQQEEIYDIHYTKENDYQSWHGKTAKFIQTLLERKFSKKLNAYQFDKLECHSCISNSRNQSLFPCEEDENCTNLSCLKIKNTDYVVNRAKKIMMSNPQLLISRELHCTNEEAVKRLEDEGFQMAETSYLYQYPVAPQKPVPEDYENADDYNADAHDYNTEYGTYHDTITELNNLFEQGKLKMYACVGDKGISLKYDKLKEKFDPVAEKLSQLDEKDKRNKEIAVEKTITDVKKEIETTDLSAIDFSDFEDRLLYFLMLPAVSKEHFPAFGIQDAFFLSDKQKLSIISNLTNETRALIKRDFIINGFKDCLGTSVKSDLYLEFAKLHLPQGLKEIQDKYNEIYEKRNKKIEEKKSTILSPAPKEKEKVA